MFGRLQAHGIVSHTLAHAHSHTQRKGERVFPVLHPCTQWPTAFFALPSSYLFSFLFELLGDLELPSKAWVMGEWGGAGHGRIIGESHN